MYVYKVKEMVLMNLIYFFNYFNTHTSSPKFEFRSLLIVADYGITYGRNLHCVTHINELKVVIKTEIINTFLLYFYSYYQNIGFFFFFEFEPFLLEGLGFMLDKTL